VGIDSDEKFNGKDSHPAGLRIKAGRMVSIGLQRFPFYTQVIREDTRTAAALNLLKNNLQKKK